MAVCPTLTIDLPLLESYLYEVRSKKEALLAVIGDKREELMSNPKFAELLKMHGVESPMKISLLQVS
jgi:hypothetical protein